MVGKLPHGGGGLILQCIKITPLISRSLWQEISTASPSIEPSRATEPGATEKILAKQNPTIQ